MANLKPGFPSCSAYFPLSFQAARACVVNDLAQLALLSLSHGAWDPILASYRAVVHRQLDKSTAEKTETQVASFLVRKGGDGWKLAADLAVMVGAKVVHTCERSVSMCIHEVRGSGSPLTPVLQSARPLSLFHPSQEEMHNEQAKQAATEKKRRNQEEKRKAQTKGLQATAAVQPAAASRPAPTLSLSDSEDEGRTTLVAVGPPAEAAPSPTGGALPARPTLAFSDDESGEAPRTAFWTLICLLYWDECKDILQSDI